MKIEQLTEDERRELTRGVPAYAERAKALRIIDAQAERIEQLRSQLIEWTNFDFDCPEEEYDPETDEYDEGGAALNRLYEKTGEVIRGE